MKRIGRTLLASWILSVPVAVFASGYIGAAADDDSSAAVSVAPASPVYLQDQSQQLRDAVADDRVSNEQVSFQAAQAFGGIPNAANMNVHPIKLSGWGRQNWVDNPDSDQRSGNLNGMTDAAGNWFSYDLPEDVAKNLRASYQMVQKLREENKVWYDDDHKLPPRVLAAYAYNPQGRKVIGIMMNRNLETVAHFLGDTVAALTLVAHEGWHAYEDANKGLNKKEEIQQEVNAFNNQADALLAWDPNSHKLSRDYHCFVVEGAACKDVQGAPPIIKEIVKHLAGIRLARLQDCGGQAIHSAAACGTTHMEAFVKSLGYKNRGQDADY